jgi:hypothetical protein
LQLPATYEDRDAGGNFVVNTSSAGEAARIREAQALSEGFKRRASSTRFDLHNWRRKEKSFINMNMETIQSCYQGIT